MDDFERSFTLRHQRHRRRRSDFVNGVKGQAADVVRTWAVDVDGVTYPPKQVFRAGTDLVDFTTHEANRVLKLFGFTPFEVGQQPQRMAPSRQSDGSETVERNGPQPLDARLVALDKALQYCSTRGEATAIDVVNAAEVFGAWLTGGGDGGGR